MTISAYPLQWPAGWKRTEPAARTWAKFGKRESNVGQAWRQLKGVTVADGTGRVREELRRMDVDENDLVISTNLRLRLDGYPRSDQSEPADPGVCVYWRTGGADRCMAIDRYARVADNLAAVAATLEAMRAIERHGGAEILDRAFTGFTALPPPMVTDWRQVLDASDPEGSYKRLRSQHHPDKGGDPAAFQRVQDAFEAWRASA